MEGAQGMLIHGPGDVQSARADSDGQAWVHMQAQRDLSAQLKPERGEELEAAIADRATAEKVGGGGAKELAARTAGDARLEKNETVHHFVSPGPDSGGGPARHFSLLSARRGSIDPKRDVVMDSLSGDSAMALADTNIDMGSAWSLYKIEPDDLPKIQSELDGHRETLDRLDIPSMLEEARSRASFAQEAPFAAPSSIMDPEFARRSRQAIEKMDEFKLRNIAIAAAMCVKKRMDPRQADQLVAHVVAIATDRSAE
ncbi:MAG: hypothetical protein ABW032_04350 [Burkholderiaceae bacterium]